MRSTTTLLAAACTAALALGACGSSNDSGGSQLELVGRQADRVGSGHHRDAGDGRRSLPAHRSGGARLQRDPAGHRRLLQVRQRQRRRPWPQAQDDRPRRRLQPDQHGQGHQAARAAGQGLRHPRRPRHADPHQGRRLPQRLARARPVRLLGLPVLGPARRTIRRRSAGSPTTRSRARSSASTIAENYKGKKVAYFLQNDDFGSDGAKGLDKYIPKEQVVAPPDLRARQHRHRAADGHAQGEGRRGRRHVHHPGLHGLVELAELKLGYHPQLVVSNVGSDPTTLNGLLEGLLQGQGAASSLIDGISQRRLPAAEQRRVQRLDRAVHRRSTTSTSRSCPSTATWSTAWAWPTPSREALQRAGANPTRQCIVQTIETRSSAGPGLVPFRYSKDSHAGYTGAQIAEIKNGEATVTGKPLVTDDGDGDITESTASPTPAPANGIPPSS